MLDREKVVAVLKRRFPGYEEGQVASAANAILGLDDDWVDVPLPPEPALCRDQCWLRRESSVGEIRVLRRVQHD